MHFGKLLFKIIAMFQRLSNSPFLRYIENTTGSVRNFAKCMYVQTISISVKIADRSPFGKELFARLTVCSLFDMFICIFIFPL